jgi:hypothetical protein
MSPNKKDKEGTNSADPGNFLEVVRERAVVLKHSSTWDYLKDQDEVDRKLAANENAPKPVPNKKLKQKYTILRQNLSRGDDRKKPRGMSDINP